MTTPSSAQKVTKYLYFRDGSLKDVRWPTSTWPPTIMTQHTYYKNGPRNLTAYGQLSGEGWYHTSRFYNARGEMTRIKHRHSNQSVGGAQWNQERIAEVVYGLDPAGNPLRIDEYYDAAGSYHRSDYEYDEFARLTGWTFGGDTKSWTYDWVGNWLTSSDGTFVTDPDVDWLDSSPAPSATYDYNKLGALEDMTVSANTDTFSYDPQELLSQVSYGGGGSSTMVWDADQQRQKLTNSGGSTYFVYDPTAGVPAVLVETDGENETFYVREPGGELIARAQGETRQYYFFDRLGSTIAMVPAVEANPTDRLFHTPWGELVTTGARASTVGTTANPYRYVGQLGYYYHHQDSGLQDWMQLGVRFYEPELGRFERRDPYRPTGNAAYGYAAAKPTRVVDPSGMIVSLPLDAAERATADIQCTKAAQSSTPTAISAWLLRMNNAESTRRLIPGGFQPVLEWYSKLGGNGVVNAVAHCVTACKIKSTCRPEACQDWQSREFLRGFPNPWRRESEMDFRNNQQGFGCADRHDGSDSGCVNCCMNKALTGSLRTLE